MQNRKGLALVLAFVVALSAAGCGQKAAPAEKAPLVKTQQAGSGMEADTGTYAGTVRGRYETNLAFQVAQARAQLDLAQRNLARYSELYQEDAVAASVLDQYQANYDAAFATYQQALATAAQGHNALGYTNLTAGADGVISKIDAEEGQVVAAGQTVMTLVQTDELEVEIAVPENHIEDVAVGTPVKVSFWALSQEGARSCADGGQHFAHLQSARLRSKPAGGHAARHDGQCGCPAVGRQRLFRCRPAALGHLPDG